VPLWRFALKGLVAFGFLLLLVDQPEDRRNRLDSTGREGQYRNETMQYGRTEAEAKMVFVFLESHSHRQGYAPARFDWRARRRGSNTDRRVCLPTDNLLIRFLVK
jgi:hypothetical protein